MSALFSTPSIEEVVAWYRIPMPERTTDGRWRVPVYFRTFRFEDGPEQRFYVGTTLLGTALSVPPDDGHAYQTEYRDVDEVIFPPSVRVTWGDAAPPARLSWWRRIVERLRPE